MTEEKILVLEDGKRFIEYLSRFEEHCLARSSLANICADDPDTLAMLLYLSDNNGCSFDEMKNKFTGFYEKGLYKKKSFDLKTIEKPLDKLSDCGLVEGRYELNGDAYEMKYYLRPDIANYLKGFSDFIDNKPLTKDMMSKHNELIRHLVLASF